MWRRKAGTTLAEAKRNAAVFLQETEQLIQQAQGQQQTDEQKLLSLIPKREEIPDDIDAHDLIQSVTREPTYLDSKGTVNPEYLKLYETAKNVLDGSARPMHTPEQLLTRAALLKDPSQSTAFEWRRYLLKLMEHSGKEYIQEITRDDALAWRAEELGRCQASTVKTRLRFLNGLFGVAEEEGWVQSNPFKDLTKRVKAKPKKKEVVVLDQADQSWQKLPQHHQLLWHILRWSGAHASEVGGLRWEDIDLQEEVIHFKSHETRPLKNSYRVRTVPIHSRLLPILKQEQLDERCEGLIFPWAYSAKRDRWCEAMHWHKIIGVSPKATHDWAATCLRSKDINESVIGRLFGHTPKTQTSVYGAVDLPTMRKALEQLT
ncbi:tyrosine-type recombinase/integrase [Synechococcus sp. KORDI-52]|uniref:tyrosine-type recombinase/integrase n=1 Tax=Synechococcus sp. KORDI-52 TaxID=585425 RepID=UPI000B0CA769|nr:tyrosine-type recombinase/integrase [Synechococcus sp. KORDI-52]